MRIQERHLPRHVVGHIGWGPSGQPYAMWELETTSGEWKTDAERVGQAHADAAALDGLPRSGWMILSVASEVSSAEVGAAVAAGAINGPDDAARHPTLAAEVEHVMEAVEDAAVDGQPITKRHVYIVVNLPRSRPMSAGAFYKVTAPIAALTDKPGWAPTPAECDQARASADAQADKLKDLGTLRPVTSGEQRHFIARMRQRGLPEDPYTREEWEPPAGRVTTLSLGEFEVLPVGRTAAARAVSQTVRVDSLQFQDIEEEAPDGTTRLATHLVDVSSFQTTLVVTALPEAWLSPGLELPRRLDRTGFSVDIAFIGATRTTEEARRSLERRKTRITGEATEDAQAFFGNPKIERATRALTRQLERHDQEHAPDHKVAILITVAAPDAETLTNRVTLVQKALGPNLVSATAPRSEQPQLFAAQIPGATPYSGLKPYLQTLHSNDLASLGPRMGTELGTPHGDIEGMLELGTEGGPARLVYDAKDYGLYAEEGDMLCEPALHRQHRSR